MYSATRDATTVSRMVTIISRSTQNDTEFSKAKKVGITYFGVVSRLRRVSTLLKGLISNFTIKDRNVYKQASPEPCDFASIVLAKGHITNSKK